MKNKVRQRTKNQTYNNHYQGNNKKQRSSQGQRTIHILSKRVVTKQFCLRVKGYWRKSMHMLCPMTSVLGTLRRSTHSCLPGTDKEQRVHEKQKATYKNPKVPWQLPRNISGCFPRSSVSKKSNFSVRDPGLIPGSGRSPGEGNGNPLQYSCLENPVERGAWQATVHEGRKTQTWLSY